METRELHLKEAIAACFKAKEPVTVANVRKRVPGDFFHDFETGKELSDEIVGQEIQAAMRPPAPAPMLIKTDPAGHPLRPVVEAAETFDETFDDAPVEAAPVEPVAELVAPPPSSTVDHAANGPGQSAQVLLDAACATEGNLVAERQSFANAVRAARAALAERVLALQMLDPHRQSHEDLAREFVRASAAQRAARKAGAKWATPPERRRGGEAAYVDVSRSYAHGGDGNDFARRQNRYGGSRGAFGKGALGTTNNDPRRGATPAPVTPQRPTIPALSK